MQTKLPHLIISEYAQSDFTTARSGRPSPESLPARNPIEHSKYLKDQLNIAWTQTDQEIVHHENRNGMYVEFKGEAGYSIITKSLEDLRGKKQKWIRLLNVQHKKINLDSKETIFATVYIPKNKKHTFFDKIEKYANNNDNKKLIEGISKIRKALDIDSFWQDSTTDIPTNEPVWCEIWLSSDTSDVIQRFEDLIESMNINSRAGFLRFPERTVKLVQVTGAELSQLTQSSDDIAEYRKAKTTAEFWVTMSNREQAEWVEDILERCDFNPDSQTAICLLDTGVNNGHPLLTRFLSITDCQSVIPEWGIQDDQNHGTPMAGIAAYGNLIEKSLASGRFQVSHRLESVKILPPKNTPNTPPELWGHITKQGVLKAEIENHDRFRILCMALTAPDNIDSGRPSSWSAAIDQICSGTEDGQRHLLILSAGNSLQMATINECGAYPQTQKQLPVQDPAQSWNALTIGSFTELTEITDPTYDGFVPVAPKSGLSPFTTTSLAWDKRWPIKPEIVMEGGNLVKDPEENTSECDDLSLLSTNKTPQTNLFTSFSMTSGSTALASHFAAQLQTEYSSYWPETIRALMIHSASWTEKMKQQFLHGTQKENYHELLRTCGYGVPDLEKARYSASNSLTLIAESQMRPFYKKENRSDISTKEMHLYNLPWPKEELLNLSDTEEVTMRITLSYFIEPGPGEIGWEHRYRYPSFGLRFDLNSPSENSDQFQHRINTAIRDEEHGHPGTISASEHWRLGEYRNHGSIHSDIWQGSAQELANSNLIAIYPITGWWKERKHLEQWVKSTRYSLVVSIETTDIEVDLYTPIAIKLGIPISIET